MKEIFKQFVTVWRERNPLQKGILITIMVFVATVLSLLLLHNSSSYVPLFPGKALSSAEWTEVRARLYECAIPFQEDKEKGLNVLAEHAAKIRSRLAELGLPKQEMGKGFELFDTNTWIKGEKELQVLEMRALKGQLEKDLSAFENIKNASVILDIPPQKSFNGPKYQTKASVILTLKQGARLSASELRAINNHLTGAVRGLEPNMIAISDTTGKLYKSIDPHGLEEGIYDSSLILEDQIEEKINELLTRLVGVERFYATVQVIKDRDIQIPHALSIAVVIDKDVIPEAMPNFQKEIERQLSACARGCGLNVEPLVDFIPFDKAKITLAAKKRVPSLGFCLTIVFILAALSCLYPFLKYYKKNKKEPEEELFQTLTRIDLNRLASCIQNEDPQTIALMLSYLEPQRADQLIRVLNPDLQEEVLLHLSELEKGEG